MKIVYKYSCFLIIMIAIVLLHSCKKLVSVDVPDDRITQEMVFSNDAAALSAMSGLYAQMIRNNLQLTSGGATMYLGLSADEIVNTVQSSNTDEFTNNELSPANTTLRFNFWAHGYTLIYQSNSLIEGLEKPSGVSPAVRAQLIGEAKTIRAFSYLYLVNIFGDVPLILTANYQHNAQLPRASISEIYSQIVLDLTDAKGLLSEVYPSSGRVRINKWAAVALLSRAYLYQKDWVKAETEASAIINSGVYNLAANPGNVFLSTSNETIWQLMSVSTTVNTWEGNVFNPAAGAIPSYVVLPSQLNSFTGADLRKSSWIKAVIVAGTTYHHPNKYKIKTSTTISEHTIVLRLAEQYLIRAEAAAQQGKIVPAQDDLNRVRFRAGLTNTSAADQGSLLLAIETERRTELCFEWGHRWMDLKRTDRINALLANKPSWQPTDALYPIPEAEIQRNPALSQNPGY